MSTVLTIFVVSLFLVASLSIVWSTVQYGISPTPSSAQACVTMANLPSIPSGSTLIDLGSGWGQLADHLANKHPDCIVCGYEKSVLPFLLSRLFFRRSNLHFYFVDFYDVRPPTNAILFCYLYPDGMKKLSAHLAGFQGILVSNTFALPNASPLQKCALQDAFQSNVCLYHLSPSSPIPLSPHRDI